MFRYIVFISLFVCTSLVSLTLATNDHICPVNITREVVTEVNTTEVVYHRIVYCCYRNYRTGYCYRTCEVSQKEVKIKKENVTELVTEEVDRCCAGYQNNTDGTCEPFCSQGCVNGNCTAPDVCECETGYNGVNCSKAVCEGGCGAGTCIDGVCNCEATMFGGPNCNQFKCYNDDQPFHIPCNRVSSIGCECDNPCYKPENNQCINIHKCNVNDVIYKAGQMSANECSKCSPSKDQYSLEPYASKQRKCNDGDLCTQNDRCDGNGGCQGKPFSCSGDCRYCTGSSCGLNTTCMAQKNNKPGEITDFSCTGKNGRLHWADPINCHKFYYCIGGKKLGVRTCPRGLIFNPTIEVCDWPNNNLDIWLPCKERLYGNTNIP